MDLHPPLIDPGEADAEWLTRTLGARGLLGGGRVTAVRCVPVPTLATGAVRLEPCYSAEVPGTAPARLFLKLSAPHGSGGAPSGGREAEFYAAVAPAVEGLPLVPCYDAAHSPESGRSHLLLADLSATHLQPRWPQPPSRARCEQAVECLGRLHAAFWEHPRLGRDLGTLPTERQLEDGMRATERMVRGFADHLGDRLARRRRSLYERMLDALPRLRGHRVRDPHERRRALTLVHGDAHFWSFLYPRERERTRMIDWQAWRPGRGSDDLAYLLALHWQPWRRRALERDLLRRYHETLVAHGVAGYGWDALWADYRASTVLNLCVPVWQWFAGLPSAVWAPRLERSFSAFRDLDCAELLDG